MADIAILALTTAGLALDDSIPFTDTSDANATKKAVGIPVLTAAQIAASATGVPGLTSAGVFSNIAGTTVATLTGTAATFPGSSTFTSYTKVTPVAVASLPAAVTAGAGARAMVNDALTPAWGAAVTGGGAVTVPVYVDATPAWIVG